ncbi:MAG: helix-turn-helix transcriptional regulator [Chloroflexi bacterium]|nr:helix-turn-helix transcriptional regulator [Chloroflexota bacterium]
MKHQGRNQSYRDIAGVFRLLSHQGRLQIVDELRKEEACVCHLQTVLGRPQAYVSQQLRVLRDAGVVADRKDGLMVYYRLTDDRVTRVIEVVLGPAGRRECVPGCPCPKCSG